MNELSTEFMKAYFRSNIVDDKVETAVTNYNLFYIKYHTDQVKDDNKLM